MGTNSKIGWTDHTYNHWIGCTEVSPGCALCYARTLDRNRYSKTLGAGTKEAPVGHWGKGAPRWRTSTAPQVLAWNKAAGQGLFRQCEACGGREFRRWDKTLPPGGLSCCKTEGCTGLPESDTTVVRPRVFCSSLSDWLDDEVPIEWLAELLGLIYSTPHLDWLLLTKRPQNFRARLLAASVSEKPLWAGHLPQGERALPSLAEHAREWLAGRPPENVWVGTTVEDQRRADERVPVLLTIPARVRFLSAEPLLGRVVLFDASEGVLRGPAVIRSGGMTIGTADEPSEGYDDSYPGIDWVICGGESGKDARPMQPDWARGLRDQCRAAGVAFFFKQWGEWSPFATQAFYEDGESIGGNCGGFHSYGMPYVERDGRTFANVAGYRDRPKMVEVRTLAEHTWGRGDKLTMTYLRAGVPAAGRLLDGVEWSEFPAITRRCGDAEDTEGSRGSEPEEAL